MYNDEVAALEERICELEDENARLESEKYYLEDVISEIERENSELLEMFRELYGLLLPDYEGPPPVYVDLQEMKERIKELQESNKK